MRTLCFCLLLGACHGNALDIDADLGSCSQWNDDDSCSSHGCMPLECTGCDTIAMFTGCYAPGANAMCETIPCPQPVSDCASYTTKEDCEANASCYAVFSQALCDCAGVYCCPMVYRSCSQGPPECVPSGDGQHCPAASICDSGYIPSYGPQGCQVGCVEAILCS